MNRRRLMKLALGASAGMSLPSLGFASFSMPQLASPKAARRVMLRSIHTGEAGEFNYVIDGEWVRPELERMFKLLRDHRSGEVHPIDPKLLEQVFLLQQQHGKDTPFEVISGYRSPKTNAMLAGRSGGVAKKSLHMQGRAIDIAMPGVPIASLHETARALKAGGVGLYSGSGFVHLDTGHVRAWGS